MSTSIYITDYSTDGSGFQGTVIFDISESSITQSLLEKMELKLKIIANG